MKEGGIPKLVALTREDENTDKETNLRTYSERIVLEVNRVRFFPQFLSLIYTRKKYCNP